MSYFFSDSCLSGGDSLTDATSADSRFAAALAVQSPQAYLLEIAMSRTSLTQLEPGGICDAAFAAAPLCSRAAIGASEGESVVYLSDTGHITLPDDPAADRLYEGRAGVPLSLSRQLSPFPDSQSDGRQAGQSRLTDGDASLGRIVTASAVDGRRVRVLSGPKEGAYADFVPIFDGRAAGWYADGDHIRLDVRDHASLLEVPVQTNLYDGTGGLEGGETLKGAPKPLLFGYCLNVAPVSVDPAMLIYQVNSGSLGGIDAVYDRGVALEGAGDSANLYAETIAAGSYMTDLARGLFRLGGMPDGQVTADAGGAEQTIADMALSMIEQAGISGAWLGRDSFSSLAQAVPGSAGLYMKSATQTVRQALRGLLAGVGACCYSGRDGRIRVGRLTEPKIEGRRLTLDAQDVREVRPLRLPDILSPATWRRRIGYGKRYTVQTSDLAASVTAERRDELSRSFDVATTVDPMVRVRHPLAADPPMLETALLEEADAAGIASHLQALHGADRLILSVRTHSIGHLVDLLDTVQLIWPRLGLENGRAFRCIGLREDCDKRETILTLWG